MTEAAYDKATEVVTEAVRDETRKADQMMVEGFKDSFMSPKNPNTSEVKKIAGKVLDMLLNRFRELTGQIADKVSEVLKTPEKKKEIKEPIKKSIRETMAAAKIEADKRNAARIQELQQKLKQNSYDMSL